MADVIPFPAPDPPNAVLATVREYFDTGYLDIIDAELVPGESLPRLAMAVRLQGRAVDRRGPIRKPAGALAGGAG